MDHIRFGKTDLSVSPMCLGTAPFGLQTDKQTAFQLLDALCEVGGNFLDTANVYCKWVPGKGNGSGSGSPGTWWLRPRAGITAFSGRG